MSENPAAGKLRPSLCRDLCRNPLGICLLLAVGTFAVYWPTIRHGFVDYDDSDYVRDNHYVQAGLSTRSLAWAGRSDVARNWHPLTMISHMADCQVYGMKPGGHHLTNLLLHVANALLLFLLLERLTGAVWRSGLVAGLFALHPLHVESVAWIAERKDVLSTFFFLLSLMAYGWYAQQSEVLGPQSKTGTGGSAARKPRSRTAEHAPHSTLHVQPPRCYGGRAPRYYVLSLVFFACGLMSKPMLVTTPFVLLLLDFWPLGRIRVRGGFPVRILIEKAPLLLLAATSSVVTFVVQQKGGAVLAVTNLPMGDRVANALMSYVRYLGKMIWPEALAPLYLRHGGWPWWGASLAAAFLVAVSAVVVWQARRRPYLPVGWFWYLGTLVPVIGLVQVGMQSMADRYTYIPLIGIFLILAWGGWDLAVRWRLPPVALAVFSGAVLAACMGLTRAQLAYWKDGETLLRRMISVTQGNYLAHYNLGNLFSRENRLGDAVKQYEAALAAEPNYAEAQNNLGTVLLRQGRFDEAIAHHQAAVRLRPEFLYYFNLANALADAGKLPDAEANYQLALKLDPRSSQAHHNLGLALQAQGQSAAATAEFRAALELQPDYESAEFNLANRLADAGQVDESIAHYLAAERLEPKRAETHNGLGICHAMQGRLAEAEREFREAIRLRTDYAGAQSNLGNALGAQNKLEEAIPCYEKALQLEPKDFQTHYNLGVTLLRLERRREAKEQFSEALRLRPDYPEVRKALADLEAGTRQ